MRHVALCLGLAFLLALIGCNRWNVINNGRDHPPVPAQVPTVAKLVEYMDLNAQRVQGIRCEDVDLSIRQGLKPIPPLSCSIACQRPRNFRMQAQLIHSQEVDLGSNNQEFWFWIKRAAPPTQYYCSYQSLADGRVRRLPFPFQPDWVVETLGMGNYGPEGRYTLQVEGDKLKLLEHVKGPQGNPLLKIIVFNRWEAKGKTPQITDYLLIDEVTRKEVCSAHVTEVQGDVRTGIVPRRIKLRWPEENMEMSMKLSNVTFNPQLPGNMFVRQPLSGVPSVDLATGRVDGQANNFQRVRGQ